MTPAFCAVCVEQQQHVPAGLLEIGRVGVPIQSQLGVGSVSPGEVGGEVPHSAINGLPAREVGSYQSAAGVSTELNQILSLPLEVTPLYLTHSTHRVNSNSKSSRVNRIHAVKETVLLMPPPSIQFISSLRRLMAISLLLHKYTTSL